MIAELLTAFALVAPVSRRRSWLVHHRPFDWFFRYRVPPWGKAMLDRLGGCETRGIPYPQNYRWDGHRAGRFQYAHSTWLRTIPYLPRSLRAVATRRPAFAASPREQDVRTFVFWPSHRGEWACAA